jgi:thermostable 8-oxoguanine DNA glycosylase
MFATGQYLTAVEAQRKLKNDYNLNLSAQAIRDALKRNGMRSRIRRKKPLLNANHKQKRLQFARKTKNWSVRDWERVIWSDETKFNVFGTEGRQYCWKEP